MSSPRMACTGTFEIGLLKRLFPYEGRPALLDPYPRLPCPNSGIYEGRSASISSTLAQDDVIRNLQTLTESSQRLSSSLKSQHPKIDWHGMAGFRNVLVHDYLGINVIRVW